MASSAENPQMAPTLCSVTAAPPPTPSTLPSLISTTDAADALSRLLHRLPPTLSLPSRLAPRTTSPPSVAFSQDNPNFLNPILSSSSTSSNSVSFNSPTTTYPQNLPFDYNDDGEEDGEDGNGESFCFDKSCSTESTQSLSSLKEFAHSLEKVGLETIKALSHAAGFENPLGEDDATDEVHNGTDSKGLLKIKSYFARFKFEDYAWRVYHERLPFKDPLDRYRVSDD
ncbi:hypothetical protein C5167_003788 [Papaver somniferum]|uniref:Uncharacterized protein n=1 Tax=Papaver somniferum TaxID=3469 RepID=A0A4Y7L5R5_PAPSO|nr:hypothetical protein C5167_003788 [Papaver somniferum]